MGEEATISTVSVSLALENCGPMVPVNHSLVDKEALGMVVVTEGVWVGRSHTWNWHCQSAAILSSKEELTRCFDVLSHLLCTGEWL